jgi:hypothetical protein
VCRKLTLQRYAHIHQSGDKYADWPWLAKLLPSSPAKPTHPPKAAGKPLPLK